MTLSPPCDYVLLGRGISFSHFTDIDSVSAVCTHSTVLSPGGTTGSPRSRACGLWDTETQRSPLSRSTILGTLSHGSREGKERRFTEAVIPHPRPPCHDHTLSSRGPESSPTGNHIYPQTVGGPGGTELGRGPFPGFLGVGPHGLFQPSIPGARIKC